MKKVKTVFDPASKLEIRAFVAFRKGPRTVKFSLFFTSWSTAAFYTQCIRECKTR